MQPDRDSAGAVGGRRARSATDGIIALGLVSAVPTVPTGLAEWLHADRQAGMTAATVGGYLGGHLSTARKVGTHDPAFGGGDAAGVAVPGSEAVDLMATTTRSAE
jgi:hypothetical protein